MSKHILPGSERKPLAGASLAGPADPNERLEVTLLLRRSDDGAMRRLLEQLAEGKEAQPVSHAAFAEKHGASAADIEAVQKFAAASHLAVVSVSAARRSVVLSGSVKDFDAAFGVKLQHYDHPGGAYRGRQGGVSVPDSLKDVVQAVLGLDNRPQARAHFRMAAAAAARAGQPVSYKPTEIAELYGFPAATGAGQSIAIIELGGGSRSTDLASYFQSLGLKAPKVVSVSVDHGRNHATGSSDGPDGEVMLDIEVAGAIAPAATLVVYYAPNTDAGFLDAVTTAIHDTKYKPSVVSISWGGPEASWTAQAMTGFDQAFQDAAALGVTVCVAAGDGGSADGESSGDHVDFPASSPHALACGGTRLLAENGAISSEVVWNELANQEGATGGGISTQFARPAWQNGLSAARTAGGSVPLAMRGVPDVAGNADPETGYAVRVDGQNTSIGGTSAVAPLWAGLLARINQLRAAKKLAPAGFVNPLLYAHDGALNDIDSGNNGTFAAAAGWDACTGLGSPDGKVLAALLVSDAGTAGGAATGEALKVKGNALKVKGNALKVKGNALEAKGDGFLAKSDALKVKGNALRAKGDDAVPRGASDQPRGRKAS